MDTEGHILRTWKNQYLGVISQGHYYAQLGYEKEGWGKFTLDDRIIWRKDEAIHHDLIVLEDRIITFSKECQPYKGRLVDFDMIVEYDHEGRQISSWSSWEHLRYLKRSHKALDLDMPKLSFLPDIVPPKETTPWGGNYDYYRFNSLQVIPPNEMDFMPGHWLITVRHGSLIWVLDQNRKIVWKAAYKDIEGCIEGPHGAQVLSNGRMLIFDNGRYRGYSRIIEIDPRNLKILWEFKKDGFFTLSQGYAQRLPNGNTLITESEKGHAFEISPEGETVWEYYNPQIQDDPKFPKSQGTRQWIYRMIWYPMNIL
jgi:hypothetical protein